MKYLLITLLAGLVFSMTPSADLHGDISWNENKKLTWADFSGPITNSHGHFAYTHTYLGYSYGWKNIGGTYKIDPNVECKFMPHKSWTVKSKQTTYLLAHEQTHFDIAELHARQLRKALSSYTYKDSYKSDIPRIAEKIFSAHKAMQAKYDVETNHSIKKDAQVKWDKKVADELKELAKYKS